MNYVKNSSPSREMIPFPLIKQFEQERGCVVSGIECYMKQYGVSKQEVHDEFWKQIVNAWKDIIKVCIRLTEVPETSPYMCCQSCMSYGFTLQGWRCIHTSWRSDGKGHHLNAYWSSTSLKILMLVLNMSTKL